MYNFLDQTISHLNLFMVRKLILKSSKTNGENIFLCDLVTSDWPLDILTPIWEGTRWVCIYDDLRNSFFS